MVALLKQDNGSHYVQLLVAIINAMISENESITVQFIIEPLASPLCSVANGNHDLITVMLCDVVIR